MDDGLVEAVAGDEEVEPDRRCHIADLEIGQEDNPQMNGVHAKLQGDRDNDRYNDDNGGEYIHQATDDQQKDIQRD